MKKLFTFSVWGLLTLVAICCSFGVAVAAPSADQGLSAGFILFGAAGTINMFETRTMLEAVHQMKRPGTFLLRTFFPGLRLFETKHVDVDIVKGKRRIAPFVNPLMEGKLVEGRGYTTESYTPPYVKPKMATTAQELLNRAPGETIYPGNKSMAQRAAVQLGKDLGELDEMITRREEWMAASALNTGTITVSGDGVEDSIDFLMPAANKITLAGTDLWTDQANSNPLNDLRDWCLIARQGSGVSPNIVVLGSSVVKAFVDHPKLKDLLDNRRINGSFFDPSTTEEGVTFVGTIRYPGVNVEVFSYDEWYVDENDVEQPMVPVDKVFLGSSRTRNSKLYGAIQDLDAKANFAVDRFPKTWTTKDPSVQWLMLQAAPLVAMLQPDAFISAKAV